MSAKVKSANHKAPEKPGLVSVLAGWAGRPDVMSLLLALATLACFWPVAFHDFVNYDDADYVGSNPHVLDGLSWAGLSWAFTTGHASNWHPLTWISHMLDVQLFGLWPGGHHLISLALHLANTLLLFAVLRRMTSAYWRSALVAALFALHPLRVESVAWISERKDVLSTFFLLLTLGAYARYALTDAGSATAAAVDSQSPAHGIETGTSRPGRRLWYVLTFFLLALGLMSKPMLVTAPFLLLLLDYWPLRRLSAATVVRLVLEKAPLLILSLLSSVVTFLVQRKGGAVSTSLPLVDRIANALVSYVRYLGKMVWPSHLSVLYPHPGQWPLWETLGAAVILLGLTIGIVGWARRQRYCFVGWFWFVGGLVPVIGLVQVGIQSMADRYTYWPMIGLFILLVWGGADLVPLGWLRSPGFTGGILALLVGCGYLTVRQVGFWRNSETLFSHAVAVTKDNYLAYNNLGFYLSNQGRNDAAIENYRASLRINPNYVDALNNMGFALAGKHQPREAVEYYERALRVQPKHAEVHNNFGNSLSELGQIDEAIRHYRLALQYQPDHADAHNNLGIALAMQGKLDEAIRHFRDAIRFKPSYASAHSNLGNALAAERQFDEAIVEYQAALRLNPKDAQAHNNLANALSEKGRLDEAIPEYGQALILNTNNPEAHYNLGLVLQRQGRRAEAITHFTEAVRLRPDYREAQKQLENAR